MTTYTIPAVTKDELQKKLEKLQKKANAYGNKGDETMIGNYPDANILDANLRKVINRGFRLPGNDHCWMNTTVRLFDTAMRAFSIPAVTETFIEGQTMIEGDLLDIVIGINRDGFVRTMTKEAYEKFVA